MFSMMSKRNQIKHKLYNRTIRNYSKTITGHEQKMDMPKLGGRWSGLVAVFRAVVGVSLVGGLLVVLLWSEQQVGVKTPAHTHFLAHARAIPEAGVSDAHHPSGDEELQLKSVKDEPSPASGPHAHRGAPSTNSTRLPQGLKVATTESPSSPQTRASPVNSSQHQLVFSIDEGDPSPPPTLPKIYVITPTYRRPEQVAELTRLSQTLMLVPNLHWLVAEDSPAPTRRVLAFLDSCSVPHTYLLGTALRRYKGANKPRGVSNRNAGLKWLKLHAKEGVIYFADDDNTYDYRIFQEIRMTRQVSMFPVGLVTRLGVSSPIVADGKLIGFYDGWIAGRKFPVDMAGFAVNVQFYLQRNGPLMPYNVGFEEDGFLKALKIRPEDIEPLADNCTKILVWHTRTVKSLPALKMPDTDKVSKTNLNALKSQLVFQLPSGLS